MRHLLHAFVACAVLAAVPQVHADWNIKHFKVVPGPMVEYSELLDPNQDIVAYENAARDEDDMVAAASLQDVERAFNEAADWYRAQGFPEPALKPVVQTPDGPAYQVYLCRPRTPSLAEAAAAALGQPSPFSRCSPDNGSGFYIPSCNNEHSRNQHLYLVTTKNLDSNGKLHHGGYQTIAHELFHAIASNTSAMRSDPGCKIGLWISEGLADAVGYDLLRDLSVDETLANGAYNAPEVWAGRFNVTINNNSVSKSWGMRPYNMPLALPNDSEFKEVALPTTTGGLVMPWYHSSSFWRFVAHASGEGWKVLLTSKTGSGKGFLNIPFSNAYTGWQRDVYWVQEGLRGKYGMGLNLMYATFVNFYAHRLPPIDPFRDTTITDVEVRRWANMTFDTCKEVELSNDNPSDVVALKIDALASACIWISPTNWPGSTQISFQAYSDDTSLLEDIIIGKPGAALLSRANPVGNLPAGQSNVAIWPDYPQDGGKPALYVVSNVGKKHPARSMPREVELWISLPESKVPARQVPASMAGVPVKDAHPPAQKRHIPSLQQQKQNLANKVAEQMERDKKTLNPYVRNANRFKRTTMVSDCPNPFVYQACGPHVSISLSLAPGTYIGPGQTSAQGGTAAQVFGGLQAMSRTSMGDQRLTMEYLDASLKQIDASQVSIAIPMIDYGYSGSFNNAAIQVTMAGDRKLSAIGPPDATGFSRLTGRVSIDEYSPVLVSGTFSAPLAEFLEPLSPDAPPRYVLRDTVSGSFRLIAPWLEDERVERLVLDTPEEMAYDIANTLGVSPDIIKKMQQDGAFNGQGGPSGGGGSGSGSGGTIETECTCECSMRESADELCALLCEEEFAECR